MIPNATPCAGGDGSVSPLGGFVRDGGKTWHIACYLKPRIEAAIQDYQAKRDEQHRIALDEEREKQAMLKQLADADALRKANEAIAARARAEAVLADAKRRALEAQNPAPAVDRFELVAQEIDIDFAEAQAKAKAEEQAALEARQKADAEALLHCVRCKTLLPVPPSSEHPRHCHKCWMDNETGQGAENKFDPDKFAKDLTKAGIRPLELD